MESIEKFRARMASAGVEVIQVEPADAVAVAVHDRTAPVPDTFQAEEQVRERLALMVAAGAGSGFDPAKAAASVERLTDRQAVTKAREDGTRRRGLRGVMFPGAATRPTKAVGRNDPCPCGSGKKFKKCHLSYRLPGSVFRGD